MSILLFPGQGSKSDGFKDLLRDSSGNPWTASIESVLDQAEEALGYNILDLTTEQLQDTTYSQNDIFVKSIALLELYKAKGGEEIQFVAGHSLGQYAACVACEGITLKDCLNLSKSRGKLMSDCTKQTHGSMVACIGKNAESRLTQLIADFQQPAGNYRQSIQQSIQQSDQQVYIANYNSAEQIVISGGTEEINKFIELCKADGLRCIKLAVSGAFHSPLMASANDEMNQLIEKTTFYDTKIGFISNKSGEVIYGAEDFRNEFIDQITSPVKWSQISHKIKLIWGNPISNKLISGKTPEIYEIGFNNILGKLVQSETGITVKLFEGGTL